MGKTGWRDSNSQSARERGPLLGKGKTKKTPSLRLPLKIPEFFLLSPEPHFSASIHPADESQHGLHAFYLEKPGVKARGERSGGELNVSKQMKKFKIS